MIGIVFKKEKMGRLLRLIYFEETNHMTNNIHEISSCTENYISNRLEKPTRVVTDFSLNVQVQRLT